MKILVIILMTIFSTPLFSEEIDRLDYVGSYSIERYSGEHYFLTELWLWKRSDQLVGVFFVYAGLGGDGPVRPMIFKIDKSIGSQGKEFSFSAKSFSFIGRFDSNTITGNLKNGSENWDGGKDKTIFTSGTNIQTISNPGTTIHTYKEWLQWVNALNLTK